MSRIGINTGTIANDGTGDSLRVAGSKINNNFLELYTYLGAGSTDTLSAPIWNKTSSGINTLSNVGVGTTNPRFALEVGAVGASGTSLWVNGDARITGILTVGSSSITFDGSTNTIKVGSGITINGNTGSINASSITIGTETLTGAGVTYIQAGSGISISQNTGKVVITSTAGVSTYATYASIAGISTVAQGLTGTPNITAGIITASSFVKSAGTSSQFLKADGSVDSSVYATQTYVGLATAGLASVSYVNTQIGLATAGLASTTYVNTQIGLATAGLASTTYVNNAVVGFITSGALSGYATQGYVNTQIGLATAGLLSSTGNGSSLTGIVTYLTAGSGISINQNTGNITITATGGGVGSGVSVSISDSAPGSPSAGNLWYNSLLGRGFIYYNDGDSSQWVDFSPAGAGGTITSSGGGESYWSQTTVGINTLSNVGIGTTNPTSRLTVSGDGRFIGVVTATSFSGSGSGLTNLPSGQLTGALPALDGSALINLPAQPGDGVNVRDDNNPVGSARTVNFGTGLDVSISGGIATVTASGGSLQSRTTVVGVTTSIANNGIGNTNITGFKSYALMKVGLSTAGWLRLYTDSTSRDNDVNRSVGEDPASGSGVIAEVVTTGISTTQIISPFVMGGNLNNPADTTIYAAITNLSGSTQAITANLTILQLEA